MAIRNQIRGLLFSATFLLGATSLALAPQYLEAQTVSGNITGNVADVSGAAIPNAKIVATNDATQVSANAAANEKGEFRFDNLPAGRYTITATAPGFSSFVLNGFQVELNRSSEAKLTLPVASASQSVQVSAEAAVSIDTTTPTLAQTFTPKEVQDLPTAATGLGVLNLSLLSPGVSTSGGLGAGTGPSVGGQRPRSNNFMIEGIDNNDKSVTGPLVQVPNDAVGEFTLITNQFSPEFGHSAGGQFNTIVTSGTNSFHGRAYEYFQNRNLNAIDATTVRSFTPTGTGQFIAPNGSTVSSPFNPRFDNNRYGGQIGGPIKKDRLFFFTNFERQTNGQNSQYGTCAPTAAGLATLASIPGLSATNLAIIQKYVKPAPAAGSDTCGASSTTAYSGPGGTGTAFDIPIGTYGVSGAAFTNYTYSTNSVDYTISQRDNLRVRYIYNKEDTQDTAAVLANFWTPIPYRYHLIAISEFHNFSPNLTNELRLGYNRYYNTTPSGSFTFPGLDSFPNLTFDDLGGLNVGPDPNAPQSTIQNLYQLVDNVSWTKGNHTLRFGFDGRKYISPQTFTQRVRGDYEWAALDDYLHDLSPTTFGERSSGNFIYYGDQTALYGYANDIWRIAPTFTLNYGLRYEFTSVPFGQRAQSLNAAASAPGYLNFGSPQPQYKNFAPRIGVAWAPNQDTSIRAGFGMAYDVLFDNLGILSSPPQFSSTEDVDPTAPKPGFLANGGLPPGNGSLQTFPTVAAQRAATSAYVPNQRLPYSETWSLSLERVFAKNYTLEARYLGTRGIHLPTQIQYNKQSPVTLANQLPTFFAAPSQAQKDALPNTLASIQQIDANGQSVTAFTPAARAAGFGPTGLSDNTHYSNITSYQPYSESNYNGGALNLTRRFQSGLQMNIAYTYSKTMDDATAEVFSTVLTPRRPQDSQNVAADYSRSALDHTHRISAEVIYDLPFFKQNNWLLKNIVGNWEIAPIYTYQSPEYFTAQSGTDSNLNGDAVDRTIVNPSGVKNTGSAITTLKNTAGDTVGYLAKNPNAEYITAGPGTLPDASRNTIPTRPIDDLDLTAMKRVNITERYAFEFQAQAYNVLNHPQFIPGFVNQVNGQAYTTSTVTSYVRANQGLFNQPQQVFSSNSRTMQLVAKFIF